MNRTELAKWERACRERVAQDGAADPAHDIQHVERVVRSAEQLAGTEGARLEVVIPAAWLHDLVTVPKTSPERAIASTLSAQAARTFLHHLGYPADLLSEPSDPFASGRSLDEQAFTVDHLKIKPFNIPGMLCTEAARAEGERRLDFMKSFIEELRREIKG